MAWLYRLSEYRAHIVGALVLFMALVASAHAILHKRDSRAAALWLGFIWLMPAVGPVLYLLLGVNRVRRRAVSLRSGVKSLPAALPPRGESLILPPPAAHMQQLTEAVGRIVNRPLTESNLVEPLVNGDEAYPAMLAAIGAARKTIALSTYIFDHDRAGRMFVDALGQAVKRGVKVRALVDDAGSHYSVPSIMHWLRKAGVPSARFLPAMAPWRLMAMNLRNHRKLLIVDGAVGFTGGLNIREGNLLAARPPHPIRDLHFHIEGPVVAQLQEAFAADWVFASREMLRGEEWFPALEKRGEVIARAIPDGPDEDFEKLAWTILAALGCARMSVQVVTPYFLPDASIVSALNLAALRGVTVDVILPAENNLPFVQWASRAMWWQILRRGCRVWLTPPPFDHSKIMLVDGQWALVGSGNWDPRSLRLNFEFNLECYCPRFVERLQDIVDTKLKAAGPVTLEQMDARSYPAKLRDGVARLFTPFL